MAYQVIICKTFQDETYKLNLGLQDKEATNTDFRRKCMSHARKQRQWKKQDDRCD